MKDTTLCYIEQDGKYLLMNRNKKENDLNHGKWIGVGGKCEEGESPEQCVRRETFEETGLTLGKIHFYGVIHFRSDIWEDEEMYLYGSDDFSGQLASDCREGTLAWIPKEQVLNIPIWEGDRLFLRKMIAGDKKIEMTLRYEGDSLVYWEDRS